MSERASIDNSNIEVKKAIIPINEKKISLQLLKDNGVLTETEYKEKIDILNNAIIMKQVKKTPEYENLKKILESDLLTNEQFDEKLLIIIENFKEYYSINAENDYNEYTWKLYNLSKINKKIDVSNYSKSDLYGKWKFKTGQIIFYKDDISNKDKLKTTWTNGLNKYGEWELHKSEISINIKEDNKYEIGLLKILELGSHILVFNTEDRKYTAIKDQT